MRTRIRLITSVLAVPALSSVLLATGGQLPRPVPAVQLQLADALFAAADYRGALGVYRQVADTPDPALQVRGRVGSVRSALRAAEFRLAATHAHALRSAAPDDPEALALSGDALWASGLFDEAEAEYGEALRRDVTCARARHGLARVMASRGRLEESLAAATAALAATPDDAEIQHTVGYVYERQHRFEEAADAYSRYLALLSPGDRAGKASWVDSHINFLRSFAGTKPFDLVSPPGTRLHTVPFTLVNGKVIVRARLNGEKTVEFTLDTGAEQTVVTERTARRLGLVRMGETLSAGVGGLGLRGVQISRLRSLQLGSLTVRNVPVLIKTPAIEGLPMGELESLSPLALGISMTVDYRQRRLTLGEPDRSMPAACELPLHLHRLATVRGSVNGEPAGFVVDTGGEVISLNIATVGAIFKPADRRRIALRVYGSSGLDPDAYLLPGVSLAFDALRLPRQPIVVLNLRAPSALLGYHIGGIVGHRFLSKYRVEFDLEQSVLRLRE